jgi:hypothetical protein
MGVKEKIIKALLRPLNAEYIRLEDDDGISGFVVSPQFAGMSSLDRQSLIDQTLGKGPTPLTPKEQRQILLIAALTPVEYSTVGAPVRIYRVKEIGGGALEILLHGGYPDAEYVQEALKNHKGVEATEPNQIAGPSDVLMSFEAKGSKTNPLTKEKALRILKKEPYIEVAANA